MSHSACIVPVAPLRVEPAHRSEQVSQLLFGEVAETLEANGDFIRVRATYDGYEGWCQASQLTTLEAGPEMAEVDELVGEWVAPVELDGTVMHVPFGSSLGLFKDGVGTIGQQTFHYRGNAWQVAGNKTAQLEEIALRFLNCPYQWGGRSVFGIDCSGYTQTVFRYLGTRLLRDAYQQAGQGEAIGFLQEAKKGDLAFFDNEQGRITHVGILLDEQNILHASGKVRLDGIDNMGIINRETGKRTHQLRVIKRLL
ncbi:hydrolase [Segetibacter sp. 3557_3]|uniref:C40 family peptidase n=1 Tax=Segetibacter sp. 3557_3 TaxID=2547429 RepID=UPI00105843DD|nr:C40 family peptidase [Segetibacter sp. 3557_3]TDH21465.1 hydrolase [Segetibacter sp. 3557_3]